MLIFLKDFLIAFIPIFVAMDAIGVLPIYIGMIEGFDKKQQKKTLIQAVITATIVGLVFIVLGKAVFNFLGITVSDFKVAGGLLLLLLSVSDLLFPDTTRQYSGGDTLGVVPLGIPLIVGPATLTTLIVQIDLVGAWMTIAAFIVNIVISFFSCRMSGTIVRILGKGGNLAVSKVANLLLAAIGVMIIRKGIFEMISSCR